MEPTREADLRERPLVAIVLCAAALVAASTWWIQSTIERQQRADIAATLRNALEITDEATSHWREHHEAVARERARSPRLLSRLQRLLESPAPYDEEARDAVRSQLAPTLVEAGHSAARIMTPQGAVLVAIGDQAPSPPLDHHLRRALDGETVSWRADGAPTMWIATPMTGKEGVVIALLLLSIELEREFSALFHRNAGERLNIVALDRAGRALSREEDESAPRGRPRAPGTERSEGLELTPYANFRGEWVIGAWGWRDDLQFTLSVEMDATDAYRSLHWSRTLVLSGTALSVLLMIGVAASLLISRRRVAESERKLLEERDKLLQYQRMVALSSDFMSLIGRDYVYRLVNRSYLDHFQLREAQIIGRHVADLLGGDSFERTVKPLLDRCFSGHTVAYREWFELPEGRRYLDVRYTPLRDGEAVVAAVASARDITQAKEAEEALEREARRDRALADIGRALLSPMSMEELSQLMLELGQRLTGSRFGYVGYIDPATGELCVPTMTREVWEHCGIVDQSLVLKKFRGLWGWVLENKRPLLCNDPINDTRSSGTPDGHIAIERFLSAPALVGDRLVGQVAFANPPRAYSEDDLRLVERLADAFALAVERNRGEQALREAKEEAEAATRAKSNFLATMSHEIRTPMNGVLGMADLLGHTPLEAKQRHYLETIHRSGRTLLRVINDILDFSKIQAGKLELELLPFDLETLLSELAELFRDRGSARGLSFTVDIAKATPGALLGDPQRLSQILFNLVGNAIKFTEEGGVELEVTPVAFNECDAIYRFTIRDSGIGIAAEHQKRLFRPFSQLDHTLTRRHGGTGLGLVICRRLVELMNGEMGFSSTPGEGSEFWFECRFGLLQGKAAEELLAAQTANPGEVGGAWHFDAHVLLAEDNPINQEVAIATLEMYGCRVSVAENGREALEGFNHHPEDFDLLLMDCEMPELDGFSTTREIRRMERARNLRRTPIIALTAHVMPEMKGRCEESGMDDFIRKPFSHQTLNRALERWLPELRRKSDRPTPSSPSPRPPPTMKPQPDLLNEEALERIRALDQDTTKGLLSKIIRHYLEDTPRRLEAIAEHLRRGESEQIRLAAHALKSASANLGANSLSEWCQRIEHACDQPERVESDLTQARRVFDQLRLQLAPLADE